MSLGVLLISQTWNPPPWFVRVTSFNFTTDQSQAITSDYSSKVWHCRHVMLHVWNSKGTGQLPPYKVIRIQIALLWLRIFNTTQRMSPEVIHGCSRGQTWQPVECVEKSNTAGMCAKNKHHTVCTLGQTNWPKYLHSGVVGAVLLINTTAKQTLIPNLGKLPYWTFSSTGLVP